MPALQTLIPGLKASTAYQHSAAHRRQLIAKRDRKIRELNQQGLMQARIAAELGVTQKTVSNVLASASKNSSSGKFTKPPPVPPVEEPAPAAPVQANAELDTEPAVTRDMRPLLRLRARFFCQFCRLRARGCYADPPPSTGTRPLPGGMSAFLGKGEWNR